MNDMGSMTGDPALTLLGTRSPQYVLRVPNERDVPTVRVELYFPAGLRVVSFGEMFGMEPAGADGFREANHGRRLDGRPSEGALRRVPIRRSESEGQHVADLATVSDIRGGDRVSGRVPTPRPKPFLASHRVRCAKGNMVGDVSPALQSPRQVHCATSTEHRPGRERTSCDARVEHRGSQPGGELMEWRGRSVRVPQ